ncbi:MFS transporter [Kribbella sandramycini]|uniref:MFS transporter n=1 Tax=Kribbella sandramycini TaxID=60450 RepID=A0A7Y4NY18_9ACTN|nr:MFS transporter [Kribbella sandramycini]MBB6568058.1 putative MFS family arabinose efflux permease [Kribbella sandramycini]NOL39348.1 MFS transporter [Kribbella sandramycini]
MAAGVTYKDVFKVPEFRAMWLAELQSVAGDQLARVALSVLVFADTGSAALTGLTYALTFVPSLLGGLFLSGLADRFPRRELILWIDGLRGCLILLVAIPGMPFWSLCVLVGIVSLLQPVFKSAQVALLPDVLGEHRFSTGMAIRSITIQSAQMAGFAGGGLLIAVFNPYVVLLLDALTFFGSALLIRLRLQPRPAAAATETPGGRRNSREVWGLLFADRGMRTLVLMLWLMALVAVYEGMAAPYAALFGGGSVTVGLILAADPLGSVVGAFLFSKYVPEARRPALLGPLTIAAAVPVALCLLRPGIVASLILFTVAGAFGTIVVMQTTTAMTLRLPDARRGQAIGISNSGLTSATGLSPLAAGLLSDATNPATAIGAFGLTGTAAALLLAIAWARSNRPQPNLSTNSAT